jgi:hypothetical protein
MSGSVTPNLGAAHVIPSQTQKEVAINGMADVLDNSVNAFSTIALTGSGAVTLTLAQTSAAGTLRFTGTTTGTLVINLPAAAARRLSIINDSAASLTMTYASGTQTVVVGAGLRQTIHGDGTAVWSVGAPTTGSGHAVANLSDLADIDESTAPTDAQVLAFVGSTGKWKPKTPVAASVAISALTDVNESTAPTDAQVLTFVSSTGKWTPRTPAPAASLSTMTDVDESTAPTDSQVLAFVGSTGKWKPKTITTGSGSALVVKNSGTVVTSAATSINVTGGATVTSDTSGNVLLNVSSMGHVRPAASAFTWAFRPTGATLTDVVGGPLVMYCPPQPGTSYPLVTMPVNSAAPYTATAVLSMQAAAEASYAVMLALDNGSGGLTILSWNGSILSTAAVSGYNSYVTGAYGLSGFAGRWQAAMPGSFSIGLRIRSDGARLYFGFFKDPLDVTEFANVGISAWSTGHAVGFGGCATNTASYETIGFRAELSDWSLTT